MPEIYLQIPPEKACCFLTRRDWETCYPHNLTGMSMESDPVFWPKTVGEISSEHLNHVIDSKWCGRDPVGVLIDGIIYDDDTFFYFSKLGEWNRRYRVVHKRPKWYDLKQYYKDYRLGVPYPSSFPKARKLPPDTVIHWIGIENWGKTSAHGQRGSPSRDQSATGKDETAQSADTDSVKTLSERKKNCCGCRCVCKNPADH